MFSFLDLSQLKMIGHTEDEIEIKLYNYSTALRDLLAVWSAVACFVPSAVRTILRMSGNHITGEAFVMMYQIRRLNVITEAVSAF